MYTKAIFFFAALLVGEVISKPSYTQGHDEHGYSHDDHDHLIYHGPTAIPHVLHDGHIADTHEVAAAKADHLSAVAKASTHGSYGSDYEHVEDNGHEGQNAYSHGQQYMFSHDDHDHLRYHGPPAIPHVLHDGHIADTHEVAAAKADHLSAVAKASSHGNYVSDYEHVEDNGRAGQNTYSHGHQYVFSHDDHDHLRYHGPTAIPHVLHDGHIADTHEVAAAKTEHLAAVGEAYTHRGNNHGEYNIQHAGEHHGHVEHAIHYHGPLAKPIVLKTGYLADTHEVAAAKEHHLETLHSKHHGHYNIYH